MVAVSTEWNWALQLRNRTTRVGTRCATRESHDLVTFFHAPSSNPSSDAIATRFSRIPIPFVAIECISRCTTWSRILRASNGRISGRDGDTAGQPGRNEAAGRVLDDIQRIFCELALHYEHECLDDGLVSGTPPRNGSRFGLTTYRI